MKRYHKTETVTIKPLPDHTWSSLTVCPCVRTHLRCRYAWVALSRSFLRCGMLEYRCLPRTYAERTYPKPADSVSTIKEKPSILSHTSTDIWHRFKFQRPMFTTYWFQLFASRNILNQFLHIWYSLAISFTTKFESQKSNYFWYFAILLSLRKKSKSGPIFATPALLCREFLREVFKMKKTNWEVFKMQEVVW